MTRSISILQLDCNSSLKTQSSCSPDLSDAGCLDRVRMTSAQKHMIAATQEASAGTVKRWMGTWMRASAGKCQRCYISSLVCVFVDNSDWQPLQRCGVDRGTKLTHRSTMLRAETKRYLRVVKVVRASPIRSWPIEACARCDRESRKLVAWRQQPAAVCRKSS